MFGADIIFFFQSIPEKWLVESMDMELVGTKGQQTV